MSYNHENVTWQTKDGSWHMGLFTRISTGGWDDDDYDSEWDDDFDFDSFEALTIKHPSPEAAWDALIRNGGHANPGGTTIVKHCDENLEEIKRYNAAAKAFLAEQKAYREQKAAQRRW